MTGAAGILVPPDRLLGGRNRRLTANAPLPLDDPGRVWVVSGGAVDVFLVERVDGIADGVRHHLMTREVGQAMFGVAPLPEEDAMALVAFGAGEAEVAELDLTELREAGASTDRHGPVTIMVEEWVATVSRALAKSAGSRPAVPVRVKAGGAALTLPAGLRLGARHGIVWVGVAGPPPLFLDVEDVPETCEGLLVPIAPTTWLSCFEPATVTVSATSKLVGDGRCWSGLAVLHRLLLTVFPLALRLAAVDEINRRHEQSQANIRAGRRAFDRLAAVLNPSRETIRTADEDDPLFEACAAVCKALGVQGAAPPPRIRDEDGGPAGGLAGLEPFLRANRLRAREVALEAGWWRYDVGPFLLLDAAGETPRAVLPGGHGGYRLFDPATRRVTRLDAAAAAKLAGRAVTFYVALPFEQLTLSGFAPLFGAGARGAGMDELGGLAALAIAVGVLGLALPLAIGVLADAVIPGRDWSLLVRVGVILTLLVVPVLFLRHAIQIAVLRLAGRRCLNFQAGVLDRLLRLPAAFFKDFTAGELTVRALSVLRVRQAITETTVVAGISGVTGAFALALMFWYDARLAAVVLPLLAGYCGVSLGVGVALARCEREIADVSGVVASRLLQMAAGIAKLRLAAAEDRALANWALDYTRLAGSRYRSRCLETVLHAAGRGTITLALTVIFAALWLRMTWGLDDQTLPLGDTLAFLVAFGIAFTGLTKAVAAGVGLFAVSPVLRHAAPILDALPETAAGKAAPGQLTGAVELSHVTFRYRPDLPPVFNDLSLSIAPGESVAVVGASGCGKSTLLRLLLGFETPDTGSVLYDGRELQGLDVGAVRRQLGVVGQNSRLMPGTLRENILGANLHRTDDDAWQAVEQVGLADDIRAMPMGLHTVVTDAGSTFSGGQIQRLLIARAIVGRPRILLLDEATSALDNRTQAIVTASLERLGVTRIAIAHRLSSVVTSGRIVFFEGGRIRETGTYQELMAADEAFARFARRQMLES